MKQNLINKYEETEQAAILFFFFFYCIRQLNAMNDLEI